MSTVRRMSTRAREPKLRWRRSRGGVALVLGLLALAAALGSTFVTSEQPVRPVTLTAGFLGTTRALVARTLVAAAATRGVEVRVVETLRTEDELDRVNTGTVDFALVAGAFRIGSHEHVREVAPLYVEALHLLVKEDLGEAVSQHLGALRGHTIDVGPRGTASASMAEAVMTFAGLVPGDGTAGGAVTIRQVEYEDLEARLARHDPSALPDAVFHLATVPSKIVLQLVAAHYRLVALPFAEAFRLGALLSENTPGSPAEIDREGTTDTVIPPFTYGTEPAIPPEELHTVGTRLLLIANERVPPRTVGLILDAVFGSRFARITEPALDRSLLTAPPRLPQHAGTVAYLARDKPVMTNEGIDALSNTLSIVGALVGGGLFLGQWWRQRRRSRRDETFGACMLQVAAIERRVSDLELSATLELEPLIALQQELLRLKSQALERFADGELGDQAALSDLLMPINAARDHIGDLILHVRDNLGERAETEGRTAQALWTEAIAKGDEPAGRS